MEASSWVPSNIQQKPTPDSDRVALERLSSSFYTRETPKGQETIWTKMSGHLVYADHTGREIIAMHPSIDPNLQVMIMIMAGAIDTQKIRKEAKI